MPILPDPPDTPMDPVAGFFAGFNSSLTRTPLALVTILVVAIVALLCAGVKGDLFWISLGVSVGAIFVWASYGTWFFVGLFALIGTVVSLCAFVMDRRATLSFFLILSAATLYFAPLTFSHHHWIRFAGVYLAVAIAYWLVPFALGRHGHASD